MAVMGEKNNLARVCKFGEELESTSNAYFIELASRSSAMKGSGSLSVTRVRRDAQRQIELIALGPHSCRGTGTVPAVGTKSDKLGRVGFIIFPLQGPQRCRQ